MNSSVNAVDQEFHLNDGEVVITCTDPKSYITYANQGFLRTSGYTLEECMGKPQNLVRHPDMPKAAFADMWKTIKAGEPWRGFVKNRRKDGRYYWVLANVTPIREGGVVTGYVSVRTKPTRSEVEAADRLYARMRAGDLGGYSLQGGELIRTGVAGVPGAIGRSSLSLRAWVSLGFLAALMLVPAILSFVPGIAPGTVASAARWCALFGVPVALVAAWFAASRIAAPIDHMIERAVLMLSGDLHSRFVPEGDERLKRLMRYLNQLNSKTIGVVDDTGAAIDGVRMAAGEVEKGNADLSSRTEEQAANLQQTAATMDEITASVTHGAENAQQATNVAREASAAAAKGGEAISRVNHTMTEITATSRRIADIIAVIDGIAFQTNILALNAAVEAARAGEQGRGFAVVASEVRALAQRSATAAKEIKDLINDSVERVDEGVRIAGDADKAMTDILSQVERVTALIGEIAGGAREQSTGIGEVNAAVSQLDQVTQSNAALVEQSAASASSLKEQADRLRTTLAVLLK
ncbi:MAG TPA: methyl-accepting chemotaxis protein [Usitatibacteraceae bacterium]|nr:methyl-accepting chemotaxis protein [Usitatibacteraceae bacterium]